MDQRAKIEDRYRKKRAEVAALEDKLRSAKTYLTALEDILKLFAESTSDEPTESKLRPGSAVDQAREHIALIGEPVHIDELMKALGKEVTRESKASLTSSLAAYVRREEIFTRPAPNTFGLIELGHDTIEEERPQPPPRFGGGGPAFGAPAKSHGFSDDLDEDVPF